MIGHHDNFQAVSQGEMADLGAAIGSACDRTAKRDKKQRKFSHPHLRPACRVLPSAYYFA
jgi:hypothetical protein